MIDNARFFAGIKNLGIDFFTGVPDSTLKDFCSYLTDTVPPADHVIAANEGGAVALACGCFLATGKPALVYMQNSGIGNAANPIVSLADPLVYKIPLLLVIGYRGEPGTKDEPQHIKQGQITLPLLATLGIEAELLPDTTEEALASLERAGKALQEGRIFALVVRSKVFAPFSEKQTIASGSDIGREEAIIRACEEIGSDGIIVSTTGKISRELYEYRKTQGESIGRDFLTVGSMGHCSQIALGIARSMPKAKVFCFDGDGSIIMHMGALAIAGASKLENFYHIVFNNGAHESVGGQPSAGFDIDIPAIAKACGYRTAIRVQSLSKLDKEIRTLIDSSGPALLEIVVGLGSRPELGRPHETPAEIKTAFMKNLNSLRDAT